MRLIWLKPAVSYSTLKILVHVIVSSACGWIEVGLL